MFGMERRGNFLSSLVSSGADRFSQAVQENVGRITNTPLMDNVEMPEAQDSFEDSAPDMILPEDEGSLGEQIMEGVEDFVPRSMTREMQNIQDSVMRAGMSSIGQEQTESLSQFIEQNRNRDILPARDIMRRRLNHFQIEQIAEKIKERLESEVKVDRERRGEEPE
ncbi:MAG: hypothetical protein GF310_05665 [candidate division Zixibacteria bacterium]|nr:hypothetical protein [candidate division Zixibacteria bacterium]